MAGGVAFDPAEFQAFKQRSTAPAPSATPAPAPSSGGFDPAEFEAFKSRAPAPAGEPGPLQIRIGGGSQPDPAAPVSDFADRFGDRSMASQTDASAEPLGRELRRVADERLVGKPSGMNDAFAAITRAGNTLALNIPRNLAAGIATVPGIGNGRSFSENYELARDQEEALARQSPKSALTGTVTGIVGGALSLPSIPVKAGAGFAGRALANLGTGAIYGGASEAFDKKTVADTATGAALGGALGAGAGAVLDAGAKVVSAFRRSNIPFRDAAGNLTDQATAALREVGIDPAQVTPQIEEAFRVKGASPAVAREAAAAEFGIPLSRGQATLDPRALQAEASSLAGSRGGRAQEIGQTFAARQGEAIDAARGQLQGMAARGGPVIDNPQSAFEAVADRTRAAGARYADDATRAQVEQEAALRAVQGPVPADPLSGATAAVEGVRDAAGRARGAYQGAYDELGQFEGQFAPDAFAQAGTRIRGMIGPDTPIAPSITPAASQALGMVEDIAGTLGLRPGEGPTLQQVNLIRKGISRLYPATAQNGTDRAALGAVRDAFDQHVQDLTEIGMFRSGPAARGPAGGGGDDLFSARITRSAGDDIAPAVEPPPPDAIVMPTARQGEPESLTRWLAKNGGIPLDAEARAADLNRVYIPGTGTLARRNAPTWDQIRVRMTEDGFLPPDAQGYAKAGEVRDFVLDAIHQERIGRGARVRLADEMRGPSQRAVERVADENADHAAMVEREARRLAIDLEPFGITSANVDRAALREAAEARVLGRVDDGVSAYDEAIARRANDPEPSRQVGDMVPDAPFPGLGDDVGPAGSTFPAGDPAPAEAMRRARGLFSEYKRAFAPRGPGDVAGQRLQRIVERDASPNEAVSMLFGSTTGRIGSGQLQTLARLREAVGADSEPWRAVQQSIIARYVGGEGRDLGRRLDYLLRGEGRQLAGSFLSAEQRAGLGRLRAAVAATETAQTGAPAWVADLERSGFDPNRIASSLFGSGVPGSRPGALNEAKAAKAFLGEGSAEWAMLRQAAVQRVTGAADPSTKAGKVVEQVRAFTDGPGSGLARELFSGEELGQLRRFAGALQATIRPDGSMRSNAGTAATAAARALDVLAGAVAFKVGGPAAAGAAYTTKPGSRVLIGGLGARTARRSFEDGAPRAPAPTRYLPTDRFAVGSGLYSGQ